MSKNFQERIEEWKNFLFIYKFALDEINTKLTILNDEFQFVHQHNPIEHVKSRIKSPESIMAKLQRKNLEVTTENVQKHINDIAGVRVTCSFTTDIYRIYDMIESQDDIQVMNVKDYVKNPKPNGYKSLHLIVEIPVYLSKGPEYVKVEIQIRTIAMDFWASLEHKIYYKFEGEIPKDLSHELKEAADIVHYLDSKMIRIMKEVTEFKEHEEAAKLEKTGVEI
ncbi:GTP pyrophosphokinase [Pseudalkalibacillus hwajinpoensis]|uniref:GTP pyrophosphokinase family protein n=1 Tax=Guptibacillus hwajinpoensis TaxID=208199 RepID=A0A4U1MKC2_9BACL|nr:GTP pyrophosphokinase family protein [Pseudalkalibacillus hwajinpoensis]TKD71064.1 GTP pyrophosphokinase family protein [Pseudalkalibacillus hwajinpoensis]